MGATFPQYVTSTTGSQAIIQDIDGDDLIRISYSANIFTLESMGTTGQILEIKSTQADNYPKVRYSGASHITYSLPATKLWRINSETTTFFQATWNSATYIYGHDGTGGDRYDYANSIDSYPYIKMLGDSYISFYTKDALYILNSSDVVLNKFDGSGAIFMLETSTPTAVTNYGAIYTKNDNKLYFQDGAGTEHEIAFV